MVEFFGLHLIGRTVVEVIYHHCTVLLAMDWLAIAISGGRLEGKLGRVQHYERLIWALWDRLRSFCQGSLWLLGVRIRFGVEIM